MLQIIIIIIIVLFIFIVIITATTINIITPINVGTKRTAPDSRWDRLPSFKYGSFDVVDRLQAFHNETYIHCAP